MKFQKGQPRPAGAGRKPGSKNKSTADIKALAQVHGPQAIERLAKILLDPLSSEKAVIAAARELLDRGYGKPTQSMELGGKDGQPLLDWTALLAKPSAEQ